jgi:hypothetical protein
MCLCSQRDTYSRQVGVILREQWGFYAYLRARGRVQLWRPCHGLGHCRHVVRLFFLFLRLLFVYCSSLLTLHLVLQELSGCMSAGLASGTTWKDTKICIGTSMTLSTKVFKVCTEATPIRRKEFKGSYTSSLSLDYVLSPWRARMTCACFFRHCQTVSKRTGCVQEPSLSTPSKKRIGSLTSSCTARVA